MEGPNLAEKARRQHTTSEMVTGKRGMILDRNGRVMARSVEVFSVYAKPAEISDYLTVANTLGPLLGLAPQELLTGSQVRDATSCGSSAKSMTIPQRPSARPASPASA